AATRFCAARACSKASGASIPTRASAPARRRSSTACAAATRTSPTTISCAPISRAGSRDTILSKNRQGAGMGANDQRQRWAFAVLSHVVLIAAWHFFVVLGNVPSFVLPSPWATVHALVQPNYRWTENVLATAGEIFGGYGLAVVIGIALAVLFTWSRVL